MELIYLYFCLVVALTSSKNNESDSILISSDKVEPWASPYILFNYLPISLLCTHSDWQFQICIEDLILVFAFFSSGRFCTGLAKGLPPEDSETATPFVG